MAKENLFSPGKKGSEQLLSIWWFFVLIIVALGVAASVLLYYGHDIDVRDIEAKVLYQNLKDCLVHQGFLVSPALGNIDIYKQCGLDRKILDCSTGSCGAYYFSLTFTGDDGMQLRNKISGGQGTFEKDCNFADSLLKAENFPKCVQGNEVILYSANGIIHKGTLQIVAGSNQIGGVTVPTSAGGT